MKIAIHQNLDIFNHSTLWTSTWTKFCIENKKEFGFINCFDNNVVSDLRNYDILLWHFTQYSLQEMQFAQSILFAAKKLGLKIFPDFMTSYHFDDKIAQSYLLETIEAKTPKFWVFYTLDSAVRFIENESLFPIIAKLKGGSGSSNVKMLKNKNQAKKYAKKMFSKGISAMPSLLFKAKSNYQSSNNFNDIIKKAKRIPDFIETLQKSKNLPKEKGYVYFQEFIPNNGYDLKVVVVGDKLSFLCRNVRKNDFRASGGGSVYYDKSLITKEIRKTAFEISKKLNFQCMGYDFVVDKNTSEAYLVEISYGFSHTAQMGLGGYWDINDVWHDVPLNAPCEVIENLINS